MEELLKVLNEIKPGVDFKTADNLVEGGILASFDILRLVNELNNEFDIEITPLHVVPENFKNAKAIWALVEKLQDED
ncbi:MAG: acyl carrier protein [Clostridia bacterium]|nr:acyl carrier protein [Clostridia bacterium]